jgi:dTDP-4-dehydrorhamnose reductase
MRVLVTGAGGLLGGRLAARLGTEFDVVAATRVSPAPEGITAVTIDLLSMPSLEHALAESRADAVVHSAALADADRCEAEPALAEASNVRACEALARLCHRSGLRLIAISTDQVFDGRRPFVSEADSPEPITTYGRTKLEGEEAILAEAPGSTVLRVALVHGRGHGRRSTASEGVEWALRAGRPLRLFTDQVRTPIDAESVADAVGRLLRGSGSGRYHLGGDERVSRYELGLRVAQIRGLDPSGITPVTETEHRLPVRRPADVSMDSERAKRELRWAPRPLESGIREGRPCPEPI